jgi:hypothetical protein
LDHLQVFLYIDTFIKNVNLKTNLVNIKMISCSLSYSQLGVIIDDPEMTNKYYIKIYLHSSIRVSHLSIGDSYEDFRRWCEPSDTIENVKERVEQIIKYHEVLRTIITHTKEGFEQIIYSKSILVHSNYYIKDKIIPEAYDNLKVPILLKIIDYDGSFLYRLDMHHVFMDGIGSNIFLQLFNEYLPNVPPLLQYKDWINYEKTNIILEDYPIEDWYQLDLPYRHCSSVLGRVMHSSLQVDHFLLRSLIRKNRVTSYTILTSVLSFLLFILCNQYTIIINNIFSNRIFPDYDQMIGLFVKIVYLKINIKQEQTLQEFIQSLFFNINNVLSIQDIYYKPNSRLLSVVTNHTKAEHSWFPHKYHKAKYPFLIYTSSSPNETNIHFYLSEILFDKYVLKEITDLYQLIFSLFDKTIHLHELFGVLQNHNSFPLYKELKLEEIK